MKCGVVCAGDMSLERRAPACIESEEVNVAIFYVVSNQTCTRAVTYTKLITKCSSYQNLLLQMEDII